MNLGMVIRKILSTRDERGRKTSDLFRLFVRRAVREMLADVCGRVLDAGGADGLLLDPGVSALSGVTTVLDLDVEALHRGRRAYGGAGAFVCGSITRMPFRNGAFETSVCIGTFYNFPSREMVALGIAELARVTGKGGRVVVEFRNAENPVVALAFRHAEKYDPSLGGLPLRAYSLADVKAMLSEAGLMVRRVKYMGVPGRRLALGFIVEAVHEPEEEK